jgi:hypothetical protein
LSNDKHPARNVFTGGWSIYPPYPIAAPPCDTRGRGGLTSTSAGELAHLHPAPVDIPFGSILNRKHLFYTNRYTIPIRKIQAVLFPDISSTFFIYYQNNTC